jgi:alpha-glucosidase
MLAREGSALPVNLAKQHFARPADERGFWVFPHRGEGSFVAESYEDDGESPNGPDGAWRIDATSDAVRIRLAIALRGTVSGSDLTLIFPAGEARQILVDGAAAREDRLSDGRRRIRAGAAD